MATMTTIRTVGEIHSIPSTSAQVLKKTNANNIDDDDDDDVVCLSSDSSDVEFVEGEGDKSTIDALQLVEDVSDLDTSNLECTSTQLPHFKVLFKNHLMEPLTFIFLLHDCSLELKLTRLVQDCGGVVYDNIKNIDSYTIVMVKDNSLHWSYLGPVFKVSFVQACIKAKKIVNISLYFKGSVKYKFTKNFNYMSVVYYKKYGWKTVPVKFLAHNKNKASPTKKSVVATPTKIVGYGDGFESSSSENEVVERSSPSRKNNLKKPEIPKQVNKHTRMLYSRQEDENILRYIVKKQAYDGIKGVMLWKIMESRDVCPRRTWQSMKERFNKRIIYELSSFKFLDEKNIKILQTSIS